MNIFTSAFSLTAKPPSDLWKVACQSKRQATALPTDRPVNHSTMIDWTPSAIRDHLHTHTYRNQLQIEKIKWTTGCSTKSSPLIFIAVLLETSVLWHCWSGIRKSIWPVKNWVMGYWRGYLSGVWCKWFAYGQADAAATRHLWLQ